MHARATTVTVPDDRQEEAVQGYRDTLTVFRGIPGNRGAILFVDRGGGKGIGLTLWESEEAMAESRERASELREQAASSVSGEIVSVEEFEVAVWDVETG